METRPEDAARAAHRSFWTRREALRVGGLTALGLGVADWLRLRAESEAAGVAPARAKSCILIWLEGGPSHLDTFDPKPEAPLEVRGPFAAIDTRAAGIRISELLPRTAGIADKLAIVRSMTSPLGEHNLGAHYVLTGYRPGPALVYPSMGSVAAKCQVEDRVLPSYIAVGDKPNDMAGPGYLDLGAAPFFPDGDPSQPDFRVRDLDPARGIAPARLERRRGYIARLDAFSRVVAAAPQLAAAPEFERAFRLITSPLARQAFDLSEESASTRARYGPRRIGASCLLARRLIERGVPFVTVSDHGWDTHENIYNRLKEGYTGGHVGKVPTFDGAFAALISDLAERGLFAETLVLVLGEFGRTPKLNTSAGRDHWPRVFSAVLAGGGVPGGQAIGRSDALAESPADRPVTPADLARTVFEILGIDPEREFRTSDGRPVKVNAGGETVKELLG